MNRKSIQTNCGQDKKVFEQNTDVHSTCPFQRLPGRDEPAPRPGAPHNHTTGRKANSFLECPVGTAELTAPCSGGCTARPRSSQAASVAQCSPAPQRPAGSLELNPGQFPDAWSVLVSKIKHRFFSEENLYGLWNLVRCLLDAWTSISLLLYSLSSLRIAALSAADSLVQGLSARRS